MLLFTLVACTPEQTSKINVGVLSGPTGMGMAKMIADNGLDSDKYSFTVFGGPDAAKNALIAGDVDAICFPTNTAANLFKATNEDIYVAAINTLGSLYVVTNESNPIDSIQDLEGKTIYASVPGSTTGPIINHILNENGINATVSFEFNGETLAEHDQLAALLGTGDVDIAILPEPKATATIVQNPDRELYTALNLSEEWDLVSLDTEPLTMGCIVFKRDFVDNFPASVNAFLKEYKASIEFINNEQNNDNAAQMIVNAGILPKLPIAKKALNNLYGSIVYLDGDEMKEALLSFYSVIGIEAPKDTFFYEAEN